MWIFNLKLPSQGQPWLNWEDLFFYCTIRHRAITIFCLVLQGVETAAQVLLECCDEETTLLTGGGPAEQSQHIPTIFGSWFCGKKVWMNRSFHSFFALAAQWYKRDYISSSLKCHSSDAEVHCITWGTPWNCMTSSWADGLHKEDSLVKEWSHASCRWRDPAEFLEPTQEMLGGKLRISQHPC